MSEKIENKFKIDLIEEAVKLRVAVREQIFSTGNFSAVHNRFLTLDKFKDENKKINKIFKIIKNKTNKFCFSDQDLKEIYILFMTNLHNNSANILKNSFYAKYTAQIITFPTDPKNEIVEISMIMRSDKNDTNIRVTLHKYLEDQSEFELPEYEIGYTNFSTPAFLKWFSIGTDMVYEEVTYINDKVAKLTI